MAFVPVPARLPAYSKFPLLMATVSWPSVASRTRMLPELVVRVSCPETLWRVSCPLLVRRVAVATWPAVSSILPLPVSASSGPVTPCSRILPLPVLTCASTQLTKSLLNSANSFRSLNVIVVAVWPPMTVSTF